MEIEFKTYSDRIILIKDGNEFVIEMSELKKVISELKKCRTEIKKELK